VSVSAAAKRDAGKWLKPEELAELIGMSTHWVREQVTAGALPFHRVGRCTRFSPDDVRAIEGRTAVPVADRPRLRRPA
jgi:excisionase family DNA binding protein